MVMTYEFVYGPYAGKVIEGRDLSMQDQRIYEAISCKLGPKTTGNGLEVALEVLSGVKLSKGTELGLYVLADKITLDYNGQGRQRYPQILERVKEAYPIEPLNEQEPPKPLELPPLSGPIAKLLNKG